MQFLKTEFHLLDPKHFGIPARKITYFAQSLLYQRTRMGLLQFYELFLAIYNQHQHRESMQARPDDVPSGNWPEQIMAKRRAKWILPLSEQVAASTLAVEKAQAWVLSVLVQLDLTLVAALTDTTAGLQTNTHGLGTSSMPSICSCRGGLWSGTWPNTKLV